MRCAMPRNTGVCVRQHMSARFGAITAPRGMWLLSRERFAQRFSSPAVMLRSRELEDEAIKAELTRFKGVGAKTVACVLMFCLERPEFPVDVHVRRVAYACCDSGATGKVAGHQMCEHRRGADRLSSRHTALQRGFDA